MNRSFAWRPTALVCCVMAALLVTPSMRAQRHELGLTLGPVLSADRQLDPRTGDASADLLQLGSGMALQANYARRLAASETLALYGEIHLLASPLRDVTTSAPAASTDFASLYLTPGLKLKLRPNERISPYALVGGGLAVYEQSRLDQAGNDNSAPRVLRRGAMVYGAGVDARMAGWLALRGEWRGYWTGSPALDARLSGGQWNQVLSGGLVFRFGR